MRLYFVRHGESEANVLRIISNRGLVHGLTQLGRQQAHALALGLPNHTIARIFSSPLLRAVETAQILAQELGAPYETTDALREYDLGVLEGRSDEQSWALVREIAVDWIDHQNWARCPAGGETFFDLRDRFVPFLEGLIRQHRSSEQQFVLVSHGGVYHVLLPLMLTNVSYEFAGEHRITNTGLIIAEPRQEGLVCLEWCGSVPPA